MKRVVKKFTVGADPIVIELHGETLQFNPELDYRTYVEWTEGGLEAKSDPVSILAQIRDLLLDDNNRSAFDLLVESDDVQIPYKLVYDIYRYLMEEYGVFAKEDASKNK